MNYRSSSWTGRAHRSLASAFGPYTDNKLEPMSPQRQRITAADVLIAVAIAAIAIAALIHFATPCAAGHLC